MSTITTVQAEKLNNDSNPSNQEISVGTLLRNALNNSPVIITFAITADATGGLSITVPENIEIVDVIIQARATSGSGTATLRSSTNAITDAIVMAVDTTMVSAGTIDDAYSTVTTASSLNVITNGAADRGLVTIIGKRS